MQSSIPVNWTVSSLKKCQLSKLSDVEKLQLKESRPTPDISIEQQCSSNGLKFFLFIYRKYVNYLLFEVMILLTNIVQIF